MKKITLITCAALALSACAKKPDAIVPISMGDVFENTSCNSAQTQLNEERATLASLSAAQESAANGDALGVFLIGVPWSSLSGNDKEGLIAASKGKVIALENRLTRC